jgi:hypothetical protein
VKILSKTRPGLTPEEMYARVARQLPKDLFPRGAKVGWWAKTVQLDLEAKGIITREKIRPLRLHRSKLIGRVAKLICEGSCYSIC